ncbi:MAG: UDP-3-O-(3-hydroxymyristoyl)glucosamine N-acyltransferase, partial [Pyrinomonadaceae bacterium]
QTGLAGSSVIGKRVILAGQVGIAGHLKVGDDAVLTAKSATSHDVEPGKIISGIPGFENKEWLRATAAYRKLGAMAQKLRELSSRISKLEDK